MYNIQDMYINCINRKLAYSIRKYEGKTSKEQGKRVKSKENAAIEVYSIVITSISTEIVLFGGIFIPPIW